MIGASAPPANSMKRSRMIPGFGAKLMTSAVRWTVLRTEMCATITSSEARTVARTMTGLLTVGSDDDGRTCRVDRGWQWSAQEAGRLVPKEADARVNHDTGLVRRAVTGYPASTARLEYCANRAPSSTMDVVGKRDVSIRAHDDEPMRPKPFPTLVVRERRRQCESRLGATRSRSSSSHRSHCRTRLNGVVRPVPSTPTLHRTPMQLQTTSRLSRRLIASHEYEPAGRRRSRYLAVIRHADRVGRRVFHHDGRELRSVIASDRSGMFPTIRRWNSPASITTRLAAC